MSQTVAGSAVLRSEFDASGVTSGVTQAKRSLADLGVSAEAASTKATAAVDRYISRLQTQNATLGMSTREADLYKLRLKGATDQQIAAADSMIRYKEATEAALAATSKYSISEAQRAAALRNLPAQMTDIVTSLQGGQRPLTVFLQQGGQIKDMFGGVGNAARAMGTYIAGMVNPLSVGLAAIGGFGVAAYIGSQEADAFTKAIVLGGNAAGVTKDQLVALSAEVAQNASATKSAAAEALAAFAQSGAATSATIGRYATVAIALQREAGVAVADTAKAFEDLKKDPVGAVEKLNDKWRFLTASVYEQIRALQEQGRTAEAAKLAQDTYADEMLARAKQVEQSLGGLEKGWRFVAHAAGKAWDAMLDVGREKTAAQKIQALNERIEALNVKSNSWAASGSEREEIESLKEQVRLINRATTAEQQVAVEKAKAAKMVQATVQWQAEGEKYLTKHQQLEKAIAEARNVGHAAGKGELEIQQRIADIRKSIFGKQDDQAAVARRNLEHAAVKASFAERVQAEIDADRLVAASHQALFLSDKDYFDWRRGSIDRIGQLKLEEADKEIKAGEKLKGSFVGESARTKEIENETKLIELKSKRRLLEQDMEQQQRSISIQEAARAKQVEMNWLQAKEAADNLIYSAARASSRAVAGVGAGSEARARADAIGGYEDKFISRKSDLGLQLQNNKITQEEYTKYLKLAQDTYDAEVAMYGQRTEAMKRMQADWTNGWTEALANYKTSALNASAGMAAAFTNAFNGITDGFANAMAENIVSGKSFEESMNSMGRTVATQFIAQILKMSVQWITTQAFMKLAAIASQNEASESVVAAKSTETTAVVGQNATQAASGAAASQAPIPGVGPMLAVAAFAAMFAFIMGKSSAGRSVAATTTVNRNPYPTGAAVPAGSSLPAVTGARALGGPVRAGGFYEVNERGPELFTVQNRSYLMMGGANGYVTPHTPDLAPAAAPAVQVNVHPMPGALAKEWFMIHRDELGKVLASGRRDNVPGFS